MLGFISGVHQLLLPQPTLRDELIAQGIQPLDGKKVAEYQKETRRLLVENHSPFWARHLHLARCMPYLKFFLFFGGFIAVLTSVVATLVCIVGLFMGYAWGFELASWIIGIAVSACITAFADENDALFIAARAGKIRWERIRLNKYNGYIPVEVKEAAQKASRCGEVFVERLYTDPFAYVQRGREKVYFAWWSTRFGEWVPIDFNEWVRQ